MRSMRIAFLLSALALPVFFLGTTDDIRTFSDPIDGLSVQFEQKGDTAQLSYFDGSQWSEWQTLAVEDEQDPALTESNLVMFPGKIEKIRIKAGDVTLHPIRISNAPLSYRIAAVNDPGKPHILTRKDWGADDDMLFRAPAPSSRPSTPAPAPPPATADNGGETESAPVSQRVKDCDDAQLNYPQEFKTTGKKTKDEEGRTYRWTRTYSKEVRLLTVHHTAISVKGDDRSGVERIRALYAYHANNRGWGDIGYHYLIDEDGNIFEGKSGGKYVVGGHTYCNNVGTIGVALLGNFEEEKPTQDQVKALQWLLHDLADTYDIDTNRQASHHGKIFEPIVGHGDLVSTECPGYYLEGAMSQIVSHVAQNETDASVKFPKVLVVKKSSSSRARTTASARGVSRAKNTLPQRVQRGLSTQASQLLRRKLRQGIDIRAGSSSSRRSVAVTSKSSISRAAVSRSSRAITSSLIRIRLTKQEKGAQYCDQIDLDALKELYRGALNCIEVDGMAAIINTLSLEDYLAGLSEEPDTEPYEKQRAFAIAARTYAAYYMHPDHRKFPGKPYDGSDSPATFQAYAGKNFESENPTWIKATRSTVHQVLTFNGEIIRAPYFSSDDGRTRSPEEAGWKNFPFAAIFASKDDPWCKGLPLRGHGVGMSGCGAKEQAYDGKSGEEILEYYYPGTKISAK
jgi:peptidoglycan hydrolase-like amidase